MDEIKKQLADAYRKLIQIDHDREVATGIYASEGRDSTMFSAGKFEGMRSAMLVVGFKPEEIQALHNEHDFCKDHHAHRCCGITCRVCDSRRKPGEAAKTG